VTIAVYPGTFDPVHYGHVDIATRAATIFDHLIVAVYNRPFKNILFPTEERLSLMRKALKEMPNIEIDSYGGLTVEYVRRKGASVIVRGLRVTYDFELEYQMALANRKLAPDVETVCLMTSLEHAFLSSSNVKEIVMHGGCVDELVPPHVAVALSEKAKALGDDINNKVRLISLRD
jgi:pantetheine-phosphate adenylyltransferase